MEEEGLKRSLSIARRSKFGRENTIEEISLPIENHTTIDEILLVRNNYDRLNIDKYHREDPK